MYIMTRHQKVKGSRSQGYAKVRHKNNNSNMKRNRFKILILPEYSPGYV